MRPVPVHLGPASRLGAVPGLDLQRVDAEPEHIRASIVSWQPDVVILEAAEMKAPPLSCCCRSFPQLRLVSLDIEDNRLLVFSGSASYKPSPEELAAGQSRGRDPGNDRTETRSEKEGRKDESILHA